MHKTFHLQSVTRLGAASKGVALALGVLVLGGAIYFLAVEQDGFNAAVPTEHNGKSPADTLPNENVQPTPTVLTIDDSLLHVLDYISQQRFMEARAAVALYKKDRPPCAQCEFLNGLSYHKEKRYELARPFFEEAIRLDPGFAPTWYFLGWCLYYLGDLDESRQAFEHHLTMDPFEGDSQFGLGLIAYDDGELDEAENRFKEAINLQENNPRRLREVAKAYARLGDVYAVRDELELAKEHLVLATELWPDHYEAQFKLARVLYRLGEDEAGDAAMEKYEEGRRRFEGELPLPKSADEEVSP